MAGRTRPPGGGSKWGSTGAGVIGRDIHPAVPDMSALLPHFDAHWREVIGSRGIDGLGLAFHPSQAPIRCRPDRRTHGKPGSDLEPMRRQPSPLAA